MSSLSVLHILRTIKDRGQVSRTELQQFTGLSWGTITNTTRELLNRNVIREEGAKSTRPGRKPTCLSVNTKSHCLIGLELAPQWVRCQVANLVGDSLWYMEWPEQATAMSGLAPEAIMEAMVALASQALALPEVTRRMCLGIGVAVPGAVDVKHGILRYAPRLPQWHDVALRKYLQDRFNVPVLLDHGPNCLALAQRWFGDAGSMENALCIHLGEGIGMGILIHGDVYRGSQDMAGEFGHMTLGASELGAAVESEGPLCACGDRGCVEAYCCASAIARNAQSLMGLGGGAVLLTIPQLVEEARKGNQAARESFARLGHYLGIAVANVIDLFNPDVIVLAGQTTQAREFFLPTMKSEMEKHAWKHANRQLLISSLGERATVLGACGMVLQSAFSMDILEEGHALPA